MIALPDLGGWVKLYRGLLLSPVWLNEYAFRVYSSLLLRSAHKTKRLAVRGADVELLAGQLLTSQADIGELTGYTRKQVRSALACLVNARAVTIGGRFGTAGTTMTIHPFPFSESRENDCAPIPKQGPVIGPVTVGVIDHEGNVEKSMRNSDFSFSGVTMEAESPPTSGPNKGSNNGPSINNDEEVKKQRIIPLPPFEKGGDEISDSVLLVLKMWREACAVAGMAYVEDAKTMRGAEAIARELLASGKVGADAVRKGMKNLLAMKAVEPKAKLYNLGTLCRGFSNFMDVEKKPDSAKTEQMIWWLWTCDVCGLTAAAKWPSDRIPQTNPCQAPRGCPGTMHPEKS